MTQDDKKALQMELMQLLNLKTQLNAHRIYIERGEYYDRHLNEKIIKDFSVTMVSRIVERLAMCEEEIDKLTTLLENEPEM
jgi:uncharacterized small protein (DUF1192 family)